MVDEPQTNQLPRRRMCRVDRMRSDPQKTLQQAREEWQRLREKQAKYLAAGRRRDARSIAHIMMHSYMVKIAAVDAAASLGKGRRTQLSAADKVEIGLTLDMKTAPDEPIKLYAQPKRSRGWRPIFVFGIRNRARQLLLKAILEPLIPVDPRQYALRGGVPAAIGAVKNAIHHGARWAMEMDFTNCFGTIDGEWLANELRAFGIPEQVTWSVAFPSADNVWTDVHDHRWLYSGLDLPNPSSLLRLKHQPGLPQGAATSSLLAEYVVSRVLERIPSTCQVVVYADNLLLMAPTRRDLETLANTCDAAVTQHLAGRFAVRRGAIRRFAEGIDFLGFKIEHFKGEPLVEPSKTAKREFARKLLRSLRGVVRGSAAAEERVRRLCQGWCSAFSMWPTVKSQVDSALFWGLLRLRGTDTPFFQVIEQWRQSNNFARHYRTSQ